MGRTHDPIRAPRALPLPFGRALFPFHTTSPGDGAPVGCASALDTALLSLRPKASRYDPSWTRVGVGDKVGATGGERFLDANVRRLRGPLDEEWVIGDRASSMTPESGRAGAGEEERLAGRKKDGVLRACMVYIRTGRVLCNKIGGVCSGQVRMNEPLLSV